MERNAELFDKIAAAIEQDPVTYDQTNWACDINSRQAPAHGCKTAFCIAGHAVHQAGCTPYVTTIIREGKALDYMLWDTVFAPGATDWENIAPAAAKLLGLRESEQRELFARSWRPPAWETVPEALRRIGRGGEINSALVQKPVVQLAHACTPDTLVQAAQQAQQLGGTP